MNNRKTLILVDGSCTISNDDMINYEIKKIPLILIRNDEEQYLADNYLSNRTLEEMINNNYTFTTSCTPIGILESLIEQNLKYYDNIIFIPIAKGYSSQYNNAISLLERFKDRLFVIDAKTYGYGVEYLAISLRIDLDTGLTIDQVLTKYSKYDEFTFSVFALNSVKGILTTGRINKTLCKILSITKIYPIIKLHRDYNKLASFSKIWANIPKKMIDIVNKCIPSFYDNNVSKICILTTFNNEKSEQKLKKLLIEWVGIKEDKIVFRRCPSIFYPIVRNKAFGLQVVVNKEINKLK